MMKMAKRKVAFILLLLTKKLPKLKTCQKYTTTQKRYKIQKDVSNAFPYFYTKELCSGHSTKAALFNGDIDYVTVCTTNQATLGLVQIRSVKAKLHR